MGESGEGPVRLRRTEGGADRLHHLPPRREGHLRGAEISRREDHQHAQRQEVAHALLQPDPLDPGGEGHHARSGPRESRSLQDAEHRGSDPARLADARGEERRLERALQQGDRRLREVSTALGSVPVVELRDVSRSFGDVKAVDHVSLVIQPGEFFALLGPSGCGKTTTLRILAGFERPSSGDVYLRGRRVNEVPPYRRETNLVFQRLALFPHMDVFDNVAFGRRVKARPPVEPNERVRRVLELVDLAGYERRRMHELSGGQQQRVAIARALVNEPAVLLLDEPLGALDLKLRLQMQRELKAMQRRSGTTFVYVTHDQGEALAMADRVAVMSAGRILQVGSPEHIYTEPTTRFVAHFIGDANVIEVVVAGRDEGGRAILTADGLRFRAAGADARTGERRHVSLRPEKIRIRAAQSAGADGHAGTVTDVTFLGPLTRYEVTIDGGVRLVVQTQTESEEHFRKDDPVSLSWSPTAAVVLKD